MTESSPGAPLPRLLVVLASNVIGGAETLSRDLLAGLAKDFQLLLLSHEAVLPLFASLSDGDASPVARIRLRSFETFGLHNPFDYRPGNFLAYARVIAELAHAEQAEAVYAVMHNASLFLSLACWRHWRRLRGRCLIGSLHGSLRGYFAQQGKPPTLTQRTLMGLAWHSLDAVITPSQGVAHELSEHFAAPASRVHAIYNGFDLARIRAQAQAAPCLTKVAPWIVTCCRLTEQKDFQTLIRAFACLQHPPLPHLLIIGEGPLHKQIEQWAREQGVSERLRMLGHLHNPFPLLRQADVFVLSSHYEGFGNVLLEAMALGVPVVASDCPSGPGEIIAADQFGRLFPPGKVSALAGLLRACLEDKALRRQLAHAGRQRAQAFAVATMVQAYQQLFVRLLLALRKK